MHRRFLFLQGPHGPFFAQLAGALERTGASCLRVAFNGGDRLMWRRPGLVRHDPRTSWPEQIGHLLDAIPADAAAGGGPSAGVRRGVTDLVIYNDTRPVHAAAVSAARARGLTVHVFEEGYLRPWWVTYERGGSNARSPLMAVPTSAMHRLSSRESIAAPDGWGTLRAHMTWGAIYHIATLAGGSTIASHRDIPLARETWLNAARLASRPWTAAVRRLASRRLWMSAAPFHVVLLQLDHDENFRRHGPFPDSAAFIDRVTADFAVGAPPHHRLVFKAHPLEDGRAPLARIIRAAASRHGLGDRVHFLPGGRLGPLLDAACSAVTVNSTAAQQAFWRGLPVLALGRAVYSRPGLPSEQSGADFFAAPDPPDRETYRVFRNCLLRTSQLPGSFYSAKGRRQLLRVLPDIMLEPRDRYRMAGLPTLMPLHAAAP